MTEIDALLREYDASANSFRELGDRVRVLIAQMLDQERIGTHSITCRLKSRESFRRKIMLKELKYENARHVTDLAGVRVITYFSDQVDQIAAVVEREFEIDKVQSVDKRASLEPDRFGYLSLHFVAGLSARRLGLPEYARYAGLKVEIQVRSILQHAWAEIEHDLGYKSAVEVPLPIRRQFARMAGLLEIADSEFVDIRRKLDAYSDAMPQRIADSADQVSIDLISLSNFAKNDPIVKKLDEAILAGLFGMPNDGLRFVEREIASEIEKLSHFGIGTIAKLRETLAREEAAILELVKWWSNQDDGYVAHPTEGKWMSVGVSLFYLCHILAVKGADERRIGEYLGRFNLGDTPDALQDFMAFARSLDRRSLE
jgi:putative GTP pyrophosphokinase